jgi:cell division septation protein DedD
VSDEKPGVHYQISVTGRQAAAFFFALLAALALAFFFGMRTGAEARRGPGAAATLAQASDLPVPTMAPSPEAAPPKAGEEVKLGFPERTKGGEAPKEASKSAPPTPAPAVPQPTMTAVPPKHTPAPKVAAKKGGPWFVQVLATKKAEEADDMTKKLRADGFKADVTPVPGKPGWFRVRIGPFADRSKAEATAAKIQKVEKTKRRPIVVS